jgi:hypothetical protein
MTFIDDHTLLRLHVEAVWGVQLATSPESETSLSRESFQPSWRLYVADMQNGERIHIWRPDVDIMEREALRKRGSVALSLPQTADDEPGMSREIALHQSAEPVIDMATAQTSARPLTLADQALIELFEPGSTTYYVHPDQHPSIGVIKDGLLLSVAHSSRRTTEACELGVATLADARRHGYALMATVVWAATVSQEGLVPIYSALATNTASLRLAAAAGYRIFASGAKIQ